MKRVLVTGGAGFIGSNLSDALLARGYAVTAIDNLAQGSRENLRTCLQNDAFRLIVGDVCDDEVVRRAMSDCDAVVHLAAVIGLKLVIESPYRTLQANVRGTEVVVEAASRRALRTIVASTSEVYGLTTRIPSSEGDPITYGSPTKGRWSYACAKAYDEFITLALHRERDLPATVVRLFNTVGPRQTARYGMVLPRFVRQALAGDALTVYGDGSQTRCFCYVGDVVQALVAMLEGTETIGDVFNVGNPEETTILGLAQRVIAHTNSSSRITYVPFNEAYEAGFEEIARRVPDISKVSRVLGFAPRTNLDQIIAAVASSVREETFA